MIYLDRCIGSCNTLNELSNEVCVPNKTGDLNLSVLNMITRINESKTLTNHMSFECKYKFVIQVKSRIMINGDAIKKKHYICEKYYIWNPATCSCKNGNYF